MNAQEIIHTWKTSDGTIQATYDDGLYLAVFHNGRLAGCNLSVSKAQEIVNRIAQTKVWGE